ncbi:MAG: carboxypeptidase-like regulatory domain-containing protein [Gemmataceae bacterium]|nr:carboxypeptidase-like regulatory domain-containing protein [Gemmataceae bacterium]
MNRRIFAGLLALGLFGCGNSQPPDRIIVTGTVKYNGQIMPYGRVTFINKADPNNRDVCSIQSDGKFVMTSVPVGPCKVVIQVNNAYDHQAYQVTGKAPPADLIPRDIAQKYSSELTTPLEVTIAPGQKSVELEIK